MRNHSQFNRLICTVLYDTRTQIILTWSNPSTYLFESFISLPDFLELSPTEGEEDDRDQGEGDDVEEGRLGRVHQEQRNERHDQTQGVD